MEQGIDAPSFRGLEIRVDRNERRLDKLEDSSQDFDKDMAVVKHKLDSLLGMVDSLGKTIRNSVVTLVVGAIVYTIAQMMS